LSSTFTVAVLASLRLTRPGSGWQVAEARLTCPGCREGYAVCAAAEGGGAGFQSRQIELTTFQTSCDLARAGEPQIEAAGHEAAEGDYGSPGDLQPAQVRHAYARPVGSVVVAAGREAYPQGLPTFRHVHHVDEVVVGRHRDAEVVRPGYVDLEGAAHLDFGEVLYVNLPNTTLASSRW